MKSRSTDPSKSKKHRLAAESGQGLVEYLIIVALMAVATIGVVRVLSQTVSSRFAIINNALQGHKKAVEAGKIENSHIKRKDLSDFYDGVGRGGSRE